jgi:hypothetical protein
VNVGPEAVQKSGARVIPSVERGIWAAALGPFQSRESYFLEHKAPTRIPRSTLGMTPIRSAFGDIPGQWRTA